jgi:glycosyltransferase involved in cell wall biosynthesis
MKVLIVANNKPGHFSPFVTDQVDALAKYGVEFDFFGVGGKGVFGYLSYLMPLKKKIDEFQPDLLHAHYGLSGLLANLQRTVPVVTTFHGSDVHSRGLNLLISKFTARYSAYNIFVSPWLLELTGYRGENKSVIPCGVSTTTFFPMDRAEARKQLGWNVNETYVLFAGAFENEVKNSTLAKAATSLLPDVCLVELRGYSREQVNLVINAANCLLMTSHREGSPVVIKEAMACGTPIVSVDVGDVKEVLAGVDGCFISTYDVKNVATHLKQALKFEGKTNGPQSIIEKGLSNELIVKQIKEIYNHVLIKKY